MNILNKRSSLRVMSAFVLTAVSLTFSGTSIAETFKASSAKHPVALIELYTSQGCSSCPPAEEWLGELDKIGIDSNQAVPLALHVNYWDYIGWKDEFAKEYFTKRQYQYRRANHSSSVYTPQIMFNGGDVRRVALHNSLAKLRQQNAVVAFDVVAKTVEDKKLNIAIDFKRIDPVAKNSNLVVVLAESNMLKAIKSGENAGRTLKHSHVVREWKKLGKIRNRHNIELAIKPEWKKKNLEVVVFVETDDLQTQQALQLALK